METPRNRDDQLAAELRELRPAPSPEFAAKLDERAAAGFPRHSRWPRLSLDRLPSMSPRRWLIPAGGLAVVAIAIATTVITSDGSQQTPQTQFSQGTAGVEEQAAKPGGSTLGKMVPFDKEAPVAPSAQAAAGSTEAEVGASSNSSFDGSGRGTGGGAHLARLHSRAVEHSAEVVLGAAPEDVADDSAQVFEAVHAHDGIVMRSSTREGQPGQAGATFELLIPSAKLGDALAALSTIDEVRSRHEATDDITAPTVSTGEVLQDSKARIDSLLSQLEGAEAESEREAVEAELAQERRHRSRLRGKLQQLERRADYSRVLLRIETGAAEESGTGGGTWGVDDALGDAGQILAVAVAVAVVGLAILGPIALVALLAWLTHRAWVRRERRRVLS
jgi:hypothetical protein